MTDIIVKNFDEGGTAVETAGTFTALLEAFSATELCEDEAANWDRQRVPLSNSRKTISTPTFYRAREAI